MAFITARTVGVALGLDLAIGVVCFTIFSILRIVRPTNKYYEPRTYYQSRGSVPGTSGGSTHSVLSQPPGYTDSSSNTTAAAPARNTDLHAANADDAPASPISSSSNQGAVPAIPAAAIGSSHLEMHGMPRPGMPLPPPLPKTLLTWVWPLLRLPEQQVIMAVGLDVAMLLRFTRFAIKLLLVLIVWCVGVVLPVNYTGRALAARTEAANYATQELARATPEQRQEVLNMANVDNKQNSFLDQLFPKIDIPKIGGEQPSPVPGNNTRPVQLGTGVDIGSLAYMIDAGLYQYSDLDLFSMANIPTDSPLLWVHLASVYVVTFITLRMLWSATSSALEVYLRHLSSSSANLDSASHTALVTDIPGLPKGTMVDKALHNPLFRLLLPPSFKRRVKATWAQIYGGQNSIKHRWHTRRRTKKSLGPDSGSSDSEQSDDQQQQQQQQHGQQQQQHDDDDDAVQIDIPDSEAHAVGSHEDADQQQQWQQQGRDSDDDLSPPQYLHSYPISDAATNSFTSPRTGSSGSSNALRRRIAATNSSMLPGSLAGPHSPHAVRFGSSASPAAAAAGHDRDSSSALDAALRAQQGVVSGSIGVGGVGVFSTEWQAAAKKLARGMPLKDCIMHEFQAVYGHDNIVACHVVTWTPKAAGLVQQYNTTRTALEDLLTSYTEQLTAAAAAKGKRQRIKAVKIRKLKYPEAQLQQQQHEDLAPAPAAAAAQKQHERHSKPDHIVITTSNSIPTDSGSNTESSRFSAADNAVHDQQQQQQQHGDLTPAAAAAAVDDTGHSAKFCCWGRHPGISSSSHSSSSTTSQAISSSKPLKASGSGGSWLHCGCFGRKVSVDAMDVLLWRLESLRQQIVRAQHEAERDPSPSAFVTFRTRTALTAAISSHHVAEAGTWQVSPAPPPDSLIWGKLGLRFWEVGLRRALVYATLVVLAVTYVVPVAAVQGLLRLEALQKYPVIGVLVSLPVVQSLLVGVLPGLALRIFVLLLPVILYALNRRAGPKGDAELDGAVATHFFYLQVVVVFLASFITGSLLNQLQLFVTSGLAPILDRLGAGVPQTASFFILYIIFTAFIGRSWGLLRPWGLLMTSIRTLSARKNGSNARRRAVIVGTYRMFGPTVPEHSIILLLGLVFSVIAPLVLVSALIFFCMALLVESYNWVWVFRRPYEGGGRLWKQLFRHVFIALYIFQAVMAALLVVKRFVWTPFIIPAFLVTLLVHHIGSRLLQRSWDVLSMKAAHILDLDDQKDAVETLRQQKQQHRLSTDTAGSIHDNLIFNPEELEQVYRNQAASWGQMYRPPAVQLLDQADAVQSGLRARVQAVQARLAAHNAAVDAAAALRRQQHGRHHHAQKEQKQEGPQGGAESAV